MPRGDKKEDVSTAGISRSSDGSRVIASSTRADGSIRKEIRVRPGYKPPEDVELYKNRTSEAWRSRGTGGVPGATPADSEDVKTTAAANKNAKRRDRKRAAAEEAAAEAKKDGAPASIDEHGATGALSVADVPKEVPLDPEAEKEKEARRLSKKLRQARDLKDKKEKGDALLPEQFEKVIRISELIRQLEVLGFDQNGERKNEDPKG